MPTNSSSYAHIPMPDGPAPEIVDAMNRFLALVNAAEIEACVVVHRLSKARGHIEGQEYVATDIEKPWHELAFSLFKVRRRAEDLRREHELAVRGVAAPSVPDPESSDAR